MTTLRTLACIVLTLTLCYFSQACSAQVDTSTDTDTSAAELISCTSASAEAGGDLTQCNTPVLTVSTNPIVVSCSRAQGRPTVAQVGIALCEQGTSARVWCCVSMPAVGQ